MKLPVRLSIAALLLTYFPGCTSSGVKNVNTATPPARVAFQRPIESPSTVRRLMAEDMEDYLTRQGFPTKVTLSGENNTVLNIESAENTRQTFDHYSGNEKVRAMWREMGFERVIVTNGTDEWAFDIK